MTSMAHITRLDNLVVNQIAAGEVIERPSSVVKELVENSLDAGSTRITVEIEGGGIQRIRVTDDGMGMSRDDALLCFERHATSKITRTEDLFAISSLGFRGEALASIAAVARVELLTCEQHASIGTRVYISGGATELVEDAARAPGTTVVVRNLFFNLPVRKGFLRSRQTELRSVTEALFRLAVARPGVGFVTKTEKRTIWNLPPASTLKDRIVQLLGPERAESLLPVRASVQGLEIEGWVQPPGEARPGKRQQIIAVNGRPAESPEIRTALTVAFQGGVMPGAHMHVYLLTTVDPRVVDVNVHPTKREVRFKDPGAIRDALIHTFRDALSVRGANMQRSLHETRIRDTVHPGDSRLAEGKRSGSVREEDQIWAFPRDSIKHFQPKHLHHHPRIELETSEVPFLQIAATYIIAPMGDSIVIFDQHACHERVLYEETIKRLSGVRAMAQQLLFPLHVDLNAREAAMADEFEREMKQVGFEIRRFGETSYLIEAVPADMMNEPDEALIKRVIEGLDDPEWSALSKHHRIASSIACHSAIRAGEHLNQEQMRDIIDRLLATDIPHSCPHGRPTFIQVTPTELERRFKRT